MQPYMNIVDEMPELDFDDLESEMEEELYDAATADDDDDADEDETWSVGGLDDYDGDDEDFDPYELLGSGDEDDD